MAAANPAYLEIIDFLAAGTTPAALISFRPSQEAQRRVSELIARRNEGTITTEESQELDDFLELEHLLIMAKARARRHVDLAE
jgi:hypothetical protein